MTYMSERPDIHAILFAYLCDHGDGCKLARAGKRTSPIARVNLHCVLLKAVHVFVFALR